MILTRIEKLLTLETTKREVASISTWPFDTHILGRFAAIVISIVAILLAGAIRSILHF